MVLLPFVTGAVNGLDTVEIRIQFPEFVPNPANVSINSIPLYQTLPGDVT